MRIRTVKPEFWRSPDMTQLDYFTRLLFIGLWNYVDDNGVGEDNVALIRSDLFPREDVEKITQLIHGALTELSVRGHVQRYEDSVTGRRYLHIKNWHHQKINRPSASKKPLPNSENAKLTGPSVNNHGALTEGSVQYQGNKGTREQGSRGGAATDAPTNGASGNPRCRKHRNDPNPPNCGDCKEARVEYEREQTAAAERQAAQRSAATQARAQCAHCDEFGWKLGPDGKPIEPADKCREPLTCSHADTGRTR